MKKRIISLLLAVILCAAFTVTVSATETDEYYVYDDADLLTDSEEYALEERLGQISGAYDAQIVIITIDSLEGTEIDEYIEFAYDTMEFGYGQNYDGVLMVVCMDPREYRILSNGFAGNAITTDDIDTIGNAIISDLSDGNYATTFDTFADKCEYYLDGYINGFPFNVGMSLLIAFGVGLIIALIVTGVWRGQLKSVRMRNQANVYVKPDSMQITQAGDYFMYRRVVRTEKPQNNSSSGGGSSRSKGGGSF